MSLNRQSWWRRPLIEIAVGVCAVCTAIIAAFWIVAVPLLTNAYAGSVVGGILGVLGALVWVRCLRDPRRVSACAIKAATANALSILFLELTLLGMSRELTVTSWQTWQTVWGVGMAAHGFMFALSCAVGFAATIATAINAARKWSSRRDTPEE